MRLCLIRVQVEAGAYDDPGYPEVSAGGDVAQVIERSCSS
jgi:hypothetical protein